MRQSVATIETFASYTQMLAKETQQYEKRNRILTNNKANMDELSEVAKRHAKTLAIQHNPVLQQKRDIEKSRPILQSIQGRMLKKSDNIFKGWMPTHVILQNRILRYYKNRDTKSLKSQTVAINSKQFGDYSDGFFNFDSYDARVTLDKLEIQLTIKGTQRLFLFKAGSLEEAQVWYYEIKNHIWHSKGKTSKLQAT